MELGRAVAPHPATCYPNAANGGSSFFRVQAQCSESVLEKSGALPITSQKLVFKCLLDTFQKQKTPKN
ncbi:hypothetical protein Y1Q_0008156 [Alligator mississippiensis]|uniref:Uncharacterized protein n=1 Tax=Alligator mississippiensis TaxID=8496 RepID=A0A151N140_ALLMI|nr:hypothetical protein Y1Q_0008156 [Alligator mississippiensis]